MDEKIKVLGHRRRKRPSAKGGTACSRAKGYAGSWPENGQNGPGGA